jgi:hypothetical protein
MSLHVINIPTSFFRDDLVSSLLTALHGRVACLHDDSWDCRIWNNFLIHPFYKLIWSHLPVITCHYLTCLVHYLTAFNVAFRSTQLENNESDMCSHITFNSNFLIQQALSNIKLASTQDSSKYKIGFPISLQFHFWSRHTHLQFTIFSVNTSLLDPYLFHLKPISFNIRLKL